MAIKGVGTSNRKKLNKFAQEGNYNELKKLFPKMADFKKWNSFLEKIKNKLSEDQINELTKLKKLIKACGYFEPPVRLKKVSTEMLLNEVAGMSFMEIARLSHKLDDNDLVMLNKRVNIRLAKGDKYLPIPNLDAKERIKNKFINGRNLKKSDIRNVDSILKNRCPIHYLLNKFKNKNVESQQLYLDLLDMICQNKRPNFVNQKNPEGKTPLKLAIETKNASAVKILIKNGADVKDYTIKNVIDLHDDEVIQLLIDKGKFDKKNYSSSFKNIINTGSHSLFKKAIMDGMKPQGNEKKNMDNIINTSFTFKSLDKDKSMTPLQYAVSQGDFKYMKKLINTYNVKIDEGTPTPLEIALDRDDFKSADFLISAAQSSWEKTSTKPPQNPPSGNLVSRTSVPLDEARIKPLIMSNRASETQSLSFAEGGRLMFSKMINDLFLEKETMYPSDPFKSITDKELKEKKYRKVAIDAEVAALKAVNEYLNKNNTTSADDDGFKKCVKEALETLRKSSKTVSKTQEILSVLSQEELKEQIYQKKKL